MIDPEVIHTITFHDKSLAHRCEPAILLVLGDADVENDFKFDAQVVAKVSTSRYSEAWDLIVFRSPLWFTTYYDAEVHAQHWIEQTRVALMDEVVDEEEGEVKVVQIKITRAPFRKDRWSCVVRMDDATWDLYPNGEGDMQ